MRTDINKTEFQALLEIPENKAKNKKREPKDLDYYDFPVEMFNGYIYIQGISKKIHEVR